MNILKDFRAWRNDEFDDSVSGLLDEVERILEKAEKNSCEGCRYSGDASFKGMKVCTECCNNYYNKWTAKKTRQSEFLRMFPNARLGEYELGRVLVFDPCDVDESIEVDSDYSCTRMEKYGDCGHCKMAYWNEEIEE